MITKKLGNISVVIFSNQEIEQTHNSCPIPNKGDYVCGETDKYCPPDGHKNCQIYDWIMEEKK